MKIGRDTVLKVAKLSRLALSDEESHSMTRQLDRILEYMEKLNGLNTDAVEPMLHANLRTSPHREDRAQSGLPMEKVLQNAPKQDGRFFLVPKIV